jgi:hypothetical protein
MSLNLIKVIKLYLRNYKTQENCLRNHSIKCLSSSAHQTITILINNILALNEKICNDWRYKKRLINAGKCFNRQTLTSQQCLQQFISQIQGIHELGLNQIIINNNSI